MMEYLRIVRHQRPHLQQRVGTVVHALLDVVNRHLALLRISIKGQQLTP